MLDSAWIIVAVPVLSFFLILFFGKKMPKHGSEIGITAIGASFVMSCIAMVQWIQRVEDAGGHGGPHRVERGAGIEQRAEQHVTGDPRGGVDPQVHAGHAGYGIEPTSTAVSSTSAARRHLLWRPASNGSARTP